MAIDGRIYGLDAGQAERVVQAIHTVALPQYTLYGVRRGTETQHSTLAQAIAAAGPDVLWTAALLGYSDAHLQGWYPGEQESGVEEPAWSIGLVD